MAAWSGRPGDAEAETTFRVGNDGEPIMVWSDRGKDIGQLLRRRRSAIVGVRAEKTGVFFWLERTSYGSIAAAIKSPGAQAATRTRMANRRRDAQPIDTEPPCQG